MAEDLLVIAPNCGSERSASLTLPLHLCREADFQPLFKPLSIVLL